MLIWDAEFLLLAYAIFLRAGAFLMLMPIVGRPVPVLVRVATAGFLGLFLAPMVPAAPTLVTDAHVSELLLLGLREIFIGFCMGFGVQLIFHLCEVAGRLISMEVGLMQSNLFNPMMGEQGTVLATGLTMLSIVLIFALEIHHYLILAFRRSLEILPAGTAELASSGVTSVVHAVGTIFLLGVQMAAPLIAVNFIVTLAFAILGRAVPSMNVMVISFGARILIGFTVLILVFIVLVQFLLGMVNSTPERMLQFLPHTP